MRVIDLFSGLGGFSQAFLDRGHDVTRYDNNERFRDVHNTIIKDVLDLTSRDITDADIILASPPCTCFSFASQGKYHPRLKAPHEAVFKSVHLVEHAINIIKEANPTFWILENPVGRLRGYIGKPSAKTTWAAWGTIYKKPTYLWGTLPPIDWKIAHTWIGDKTGGAGNGAIGSPYPTDSAEIAIIPYDFSLAVCLAVEGNSQQLTLKEAQGER